MDRIDFAVDELYELAGAVFENYPLKRLSTLGVGGAARAAFFPKSRDSLVSAVKMLREVNVPLKVIGNGSNLLFSDEGFSGVVIKPLLSEIRFEGARVTAESGVPLQTLIIECEKRGLGGLEKLSLIPSRAGGAIKQNAGAFSSTIGDKIERVTVCGGDIRTLSKGECGFSYRHSEIGGIILSADFLLEYFDKGELMLKRKSVEALRKERQPHGARTCGSVFKNGEGYYAADLIERAGLKGFRIGGAQVSRKHANFIENVANSTSKDISNLIYTVKEKVYNVFKIKLLEEVEAFPN